MKSWIELVSCSSHNDGLIGLKPANCKELAARTGFVNPLSRRDAADGRFKANHSGGGQEAVGFGARRQRMHPYAILLASRPQPLGPPSTRNYGWNRALVKASHDRRDARRQSRFFLVRQLIHNLCNVFGDRLGPLRLNYSGVSPSQSHDL